MLRRRGIDVVAFGRSLEDDGDHYLMRAYASLEDLERSESDFYGSERWRLGPRDAIIACIENYTSVVIEIDDGTLEGLRDISGEDPRSESRPTGPNGSG